MPRTAQPELIAGLQAALVRLVFLFEGFFTTPPTRFWSGVGTLNWNGADWVGAGELISVGPATESTEMKAQGITIALSGIPPELLALVFLYLRQGQRVNVYVGIMSNAGQLTANPAVYFSGRVDVPSITDAGDTATITLAVENRFVDFEKNRSLFYTPQSQAIYFSGDRGFDQVSALQESKNILGHLVVITRKQSWQIDMANAIEAAGAAPFAWGTNDCSLFVCDVILAMTGTDLGADFRGKYDSKESAAAVIAFATDGAGLEQLIEQMCWQNQMPEVEVNFAWRGDVALHDTSEGPCLGIIDGEGGAYLTEKHGLLFLARGDIRRTWRV